MDMQIFPRINDIIFFLFKFNFLNIIKFIFCASALKKILQTSGLASLAYPVTVSINFFYKKKIL